ncbi:PIG-L deacetylase family protein [Melittangium boletus]|uniref:PIG-L deacetylase family protein n=1 Tax=Melittangium boletus TaxID=83453 RepID=UPI003DA6A4B1
MWPPDERMALDGTAPRERTVAEVLEPLVSAQALRGPVLFVAAHPEESVQGASWLLRRSPGCHVVHVTDGVPRRSHPEGPPHGAQARLREEESFEALSLAGLTPDQLLSLGAVAEEAPWELVTLTECLLALVKALRPSLLVVPPYTGSDADQDATAFVAHAAVALLRRGGRSEPVLLEMLPPVGGALSGPAVARVHLTDEGRATKQRMLACARSRGAPWVAWEQENYRRAPRYDFTRPSREAFAAESPARRLTPADWRRLTRHALEELKLVEAPWH